MYRRLSPLLLLCILLLAPTAGTSRAQDRTVRVRILERYTPKDIWVEAVDKAARFLNEETGAPMGSLAPGERARIALVSGKVCVVLPSGEVSAAEVLVVPGSSGSLRMDVVKSRPLPRPRTYRGRLRIDPKEAGVPGLRLINTLGLEEYVASVLPHEYPFADPEGAKAMAVVIRTYALRSMGRYGRDYDQVDHTDSQVYKGSAGITPLSRQAAAATEGEVLAYGGRLIEATYYASNGGYTANNDDVWTGAALPYLRAKADPYDQATDHAWTSTLPRVQVLGVLTAAYGRGERVADFEPVAYGEDGRARFVRVKLADGTVRTISSNRFRAVICRHFGVKSLRSTRFSVSRTEDDYVLSGSGYGHGVGMSQWGAHEMAQRGYSYRDILAFYYAGTRLGRYGALDLASEAEPTTRNSRQQRAGQSSGQGVELTRSGW